MNTAKQWSEKLTRARAALIGLDDATSYKRVHVLAERAKQAYTTARVIVGRIDIERATITYPVQDDGGHAITASVVKRPTEVQALQLIREQRLIDRLPAPVVLLPKAVDLRWCAICERKHPAAQFVKNRARLHGYGYACAACRDELRRVGWRRAG